MPLSFCLEFIIITVRKTLVGGVKVFFFFFFLKKIFKLCAIVGRREGDTSELETSSNAISIITQPQVLVFAEKRGNRWVYNNSYTFSSEWESEIKSVDNQDWL